MQSEIDRMGGFAQPASLPWIEGPGKMAILAITGRHVCDSTLCDRSNHMLSPMMQVRDEEMELWEPDGKLRLGKSGRSCFDPFPLNLVEMRSSPPLQFSVIINFKLG
jgi:hypothetical protein